MFENNTGAHVAIVKYILVGVLLTVSILALGWGVWSYTYQQNLADVPPPTGDSDPAARYTEAEWEAIRNADTGSSTPRYADEEWNEIRGTDTEANAAATTSAGYSEDEWNAIRSGG